MEEAAQDEVLTTVRNLLVTGAFSDLTVTCGSDTYKVHKNIVCSRVEFFARAMKFGGKEANESTVDLPDDEPAIVNLLFHWIYKGKYEPSAAKPPASSAFPKTPKKITALVPRSERLTEGYVPPSLRNRPGISEPQFPHTCKHTFSGCQTKVCHHHTCRTDCNSDCTAFTCRTCEPFRGEPDELLVHAKMYEIADKYYIPELKELVKEKFSQACKLLWEAPTFGIAAHYAFSTTPDQDKGLRDIISATIAAHMKALLEKPEIEALLTEFNGLAYGLLKTQVYPASQRNGFGMR